MKTSLLTIGVFSFMSFTALKATTVLFGSNPSNRTVANEAGTNYTGTASSGSVWIGTFSNEAGFGATANNLLDVATNVANITAAGGWEQFTMDTATSTVNTSVTNTVDFTNIAGTVRIGGQATDNNSGATKADFFNGKQIYIWVFNADTIGAATEMGIFEATAATVAWFFPNNGNGVGDSVTLSTLVSGSTIAAVNGVGSVSGSQLRTEVYGVPEPSRLMLLGLGGLEVFFRRRRR